MRYLHNFNQLKFLLPLIFAFAGGTASLFATWQIGGVVNRSSQDQIHTRVNQLSAMASSLIQQRTQLEMRSAGRSNTPDKNLISRQSNAAMQNFPGQIVLLEKNSSVTLFSSLSATDLDDVFRGLINNNSKDVFTLDLGNMSYVVARKELVFSRDYMVDGYFMMRQEMLNKPYKSILFRINLWQIVGVLLLAAAGWFFGRWMAAKLMAIQQVVQEAEQGEKPEPIIESGPTELKELVKALNFLLQGPTAKDKVRQEANTDALTGLLNRRGFIQAMDEKFSKGGNAAEMSVMFMDLDGFKPINDTYGHDVGDDILNDVGQRLNHCAREEDLVCRLGGDEFVLLFPGLKDQKVLEDRADRVLAKLNDPYWIEDKRVTMGASIGISIGPADGKTGEELLNAADEAMYAAKKTGKNQFTFYS